MTTARLLQIRHIAVQPRSPAVEWPLAHCLLGALFVGVIAVLSLPAARADSTTLGWMPLWLLGMPLASLCALAFMHAMRRTPDHAA